MNLLGIFRTTSKYDELMKLYVSIEDELLKEKESHRETIKDHKKTIKRAEGYIDALLEFNHLMKDMLDGWKDCTAEDLQGWKDRYAKIEIGDRNDN